MKKGMMKKLAIILSALTLSCGILGIIPMLQKNALKVEAAGTVLTFNADNWTVESGGLSDGNVLSVTGEGKTLIHSNQTYKNFHLTYKTQYSSSSTSGDPWYGRSGVILRSENSGADGFYLGFYGWDNLLWASTGNFVDNVFYHMNGVDAGWGAVGFNEHVIDLYVYGSSCNIIINGWLFQNVPMPYDESGHISIISEGATATYGDFYIEELADDFDYASLITRANWSGNNFSGEQWYWYESGKDQSFRMKLPDDLTGITKYYLARTSKVADNGQSVDVLIDKTGTKTASDDWGEKVFTWGDYNGAKAGSFATNIVAFDPSVFEGVAGGSTVGFYLDKNQDGWYSANNYWLLYEKNGKIYVADYFDLVYGFDRDSHAYVWANANNYIRGYWFIRQEDLSLISFARGEEAVFVQNPVMTKIKNVEYTFAENEGEKTLDMSEYISVVKKGIGYTLSYAVDGVQVDSVVLAPATKSGVITVTCSADGNSINNGGTVGFTPIVVEIPYSTYYPVSITLKDGEKVLNNLNGYVNDMIDLSLYLPEKEGHRFIGWTDGINDYSANSKITLSEDMILTAKWEVITYTVKIFDGESEIYNERINYGELFDFTPAQKEGYTFNAFYSDKEYENKVELPISINKDTTLYALYDSNKYTITLDYCTDAVNSFVEVQFGKQITSLPSDVADNGTRAFLGWYTLAEGGIRYQNGDVWNIAENMTLYAQYTPVVAYNVTLNLNGGTATSAITSIQVTFGTVINDLPSVEKIGYEFIGWWTSDKDGVKYENGDVWNEDETSVSNLYARFIPCEYNVVYVMNGGVNSDENLGSYVFGEGLVLAIPEKNHYAFEGWYLEENFVTKIESISASDTGDKTLYAKWKLDSFNIVYELNGGRNSDLNPSTYEYGTTFILENPIKEGFDFAGWYIDGEFSVKSNEITASDEGDKIFYAKWIEIISIVFKDGESVLNTVNGHLGDVIDLAEYKPAKEGYLFLGWSDGKDDISSTSSITLSEDMTLNAKWVVIEYLVKIFDGETEVYGASVVHGGSVDFVPEDKVGWAFVGYYSDSELSQKTQLPTVINSNITLYLAYQLNTYVITVNAYEGFVSSQTVMHGEIFAPEIPVREGYNFIGWYTDAECTVIYEAGAVSEEFELFAKWEEIKDVSSSQLPSCFASVEQSAGTFIAFMIASLLFVIIKRKIYENN